MEAARSKDLVPSQKEGSHIAAESMMIHPKLTILFKVITITLNTSQRVLGSCQVTDLLENML
jgi:hypothetical protein